MAASKTINFTNTGTYRNRQSGGTVSLFPTYNNLSYISFSVCHVRSSVFPCLILVYSLPLCSPVLLMDAALPSSCLCLWDTLLSVYLCIFFLRYILSVLFFQTTFPNDVTEELQLPSSNAPHKRYIRSCSSKSFFICYIDGPRYFQYSSI